MKVANQFQLHHNVTFRVLDSITGKLIQEHTGHNTATNTLIEGIGHYLAGAGVYRQGPNTLADYIPRYISLGTLGLLNQDEDAQHLPTGVSGIVPTPRPSEVEKFKAYYDQRPGYGTDGYAKNYNHERKYNSSKSCFGLGPAFTSFSITSDYKKNDIVYYKGVAYRATADITVNPKSGIYNVWQSDKWIKAPASEQPIGWELISPSSPRVEISFRDIVPEYQATESQTVDVVYSAMISSAYLQEFMDVLNPGKNYLFITEAGLWSDSTYHSCNEGLNGLLAGYRITYPDLDPRNPDFNRLKQEILRVERGQVVQVIWKIQVGNLTAKHFNSI